MSFESFEATMTKPTSDLALDANMAIADFEKMDHSLISHICILALEKFKKSRNRQPVSWELSDAVEFVEIARKVAVESGVDEKDLGEDSKMMRTFYLFSFQSRGVFSPLAAFMGGVVAQECMKAITQKFSPIKQLFYYDASEVLPEFKPSEHIPKEGTLEEKAKKFKEDFADMFIFGGDPDRTEGLRVVVGKEVVEKLSYSNIFMVGAGAIGCELLKLYAMLNIGCGKKTKDQAKPGSIVLTDPDVIEVSNLNRQFLFREKHLRKPKSSTAAAAAIQMNPGLKGNIVARLDKVHDGTSHIFTDNFFSNLTLVTNALDNIAARKYVDQRCVTAQVPLIESGTLGPKGHV